MRCGQSLGWRGLGASLILLGLAALCPAGAIVVNVEGGEPVSAIALSRRLKVETDGRVDGNTVRFDKLLPDTPYDIEITLKDGTILAGMDLGWYEEEPAQLPRPKAEPLTDADREEIRAIVQDIPSFYNRTELLALAGDRDRAVALVQLIRDTPFHGAAPGEIIWRVELYYFKFQAGGWEKVQQQNQPLRRDRLRNRQQYEDVVGPLRWTERLGGLRVGKDETRTITIAAQPKKQP